MESEERVRFILTKKGIALMLLAGFALIAPPLLGAMLGAGTALFALGIIYAYNFFKSEVPGPENEQGGFKLR